MLREGRGEEGRRGRKIGGRGEEGREGRRDRRTGEKEGEEGRRREGGTGGVGREGWRTRERKAIVNVHFLIQYTTIKECSHPITPRAGC